MHNLASKPAASFTQCGFSSDIPASPPPKSKDVQDKLLLPSYSVVATGFNVSMNGRPG